MKTESKSKTLYRYYCKMRPPAPGAVSKRNLYASFTAHFPFAGGDRYYELVPGGTAELKG